MKRYITGFMIAMVLFVGASGVLASSDKGLPFSEIWEAIFSIQDDIENIELTPGPTGQQGEKGETGPQGDKGNKGDKGDQGEPGVSAQHGAGNIAFCSNELPSCLKVLKTDGTVWYLHENGTWQPFPNHPNSVPIPTADIVSWSPNRFLDKNGDVWKFSGNSENNVWTNVGHP